MADKPGAPGTPTVDSASSTSITISWSAGTNGGSAITGYRVYMNDLSTDAWTLVYNGQNNPSVLSFN